MSDEERRDESAIISNVDPNSWEAINVMSERNRSNLFCGLVGECRLIHSRLASKPASFFWLPIKVIDAILRGFSQVVFANNTISGLFVIIGLAVADGAVCGAGLLAALLATITALVFNQSWDAVSNGLTTYNGVLVGTVTASLYPTIAASTHGPDYVAWCLIALGGIMSPLLTSSIRNLFKSSSLPAMTVPFNLIGMLVFVCLPSMLKHLAPPHLSHLDEISNMTSENGTTIDWLLVMRGSLVSMSQVYAVDNIICSVVMYAGILIFSPLLSLSLYVGSLLGSFCGLILTIDYATVYSGLWGYNAALSCAAVAVVFYVPTVLSVFNAILAVIFTTAVQFALSSALAPAGLPVLTLPFVISCAIFLAVSSGDGPEGLLKAPDGQPPECQRRRYNRERRRQRSNIDNI